MLDKVWDLDKCLMYQDPSLCEVIELTQDMGIYPRYVRRDAKSFTTYEIFLYGDQSFCITTRSLIQKDRMELYFKELFRILNAYASILILNTYMYFIHMYMRDYLSESAISMYCQSDCCSSMSFFTQEKHFYIEMNMMIDPVAVNMRFMQNRHKRLLTYSADNIQVTAKEIAQNIFMGFYFKGGNAFIIDNRIKYEVLEILEDMGGVETFPPSVGNLMEARHVKIGDIYMSIRICSLHDMGMVAITVSSQNRSAFHTFKKSRYEGTKKIIKQMIKEVTLEHRQGCD